VIILIDQKEYAVGLNWFAISTTQELEQFQREMELHYGITKMSKESAVQSTVALCGPEYNGQVSLAGILSYAYQHLIYVKATEYKDEQGQPLYYLCAIKNHAVTVDGDHLDTRDAILSLYAQNYADITGDIDPNNVNCFGTGVEEALFPGIHLMESHQVLDQAQRYASQATIKLLGKRGLSAGSVALVVLLFLASGYFLYDSFLKPPPPPPPAPAQPIAPVVPPRDLHKEFLDKFSLSLAKQMRVTVIPSVVAGVKQLPLAFGGWQIKTITFTGEKPDIFRLNLDRSNFANVEDLMVHNDKGFFTGVQVDISGSHAVADYPFTPEHLDFLPPENFSNLSSNGGAHYYELIGKLQVYNLPYSGKEGASNSYFSETEITFHGVGLWSLMALYEVLLPFETLAVKTIEITIENGTYNWKIEGMIYG
jgi:hypothetical protein